MSKSITRVLLVVCAVCLALLGVSCEQKKPIGQAPAKTQSAELKKLSFGPVAGTSLGQFIAQTDSKTFSLSGADNPKQPTAWEGPLVITDGRSGKSCRAEVSLVKEVYSVDKGDLALVLSYSGSMNYIYFIDTEICSNKHPRLELFTEGISVVDNRIMVLPACECPGQNAPCGCAAGQVVALNEQYQPIVLENESRELTKKTLGVEFRGRRKVANPKTPSASLLPE